MTRQTATKWVRRYRADGVAGLDDQSSGPTARHVPCPLRRSRRSSSPATLGFGPRRLAPLVGVPRSTIGDVLRRQGLSRLRDRDRPTGIPIRYVRERPGELDHMDVKKLAGSPTAVATTSAAGVTARRGPAAATTTSIRSSTT